MTIFTLLPYAERSILAGVTFLSSISLLALVIYGILSRSRAWIATINGTLLLMTTGFAAYVMCVAAEPENYPLSFPWLWILMIAIPLLIYGIGAIIITHYNHKNVLSPSSVKETLDDLDSGVCFADGSGRIILVNKAMAKLASVLLGSYPQTIAELNAALARADGNVEKLDENLYRFGGGKVWRFVTVPFEDKALTGFTQTTAQDVTEVYETNDKIRRENEKLQEAIEETKKLMVRLADRVREQETLALKIKVHNDIGASLIALSQVLTTGDDDNVENLLRDLQHAVWHFNTSDEANKDTFDDVIKQAKTMGISLTLQGKIPTELRFEKVIVLAARESVTNCSKHAGGNAVNIRITQRDDLYVVEITNNGDPPKEEIMEGGGLTSLRQTIENAGGKMYVSHKPTFILILNLPREEKRK